MRLLLDTNVVVAGLLWSGPPRRLLQAAIDGQVQLFSSRALLEELTSTLGYDRLCKRIEAIGASAPALAKHYADLVTLVEPSEMKDVVFDDPDDDVVVAAALAASVGCIVSGDKHLLRLHGHIEVPVLTAAQVVAQLD